MQTWLRRVSLGGMRISGQISALLVLVGLCVVPVRSVAQKPILTWHYDNGRTGSNTKEVVLTPANVNYKTFGQLSIKPVDGYVAAQPLYVPKLNIVGQGSHDVVLVATMHGSVYAFDADDTNTSPLWFTSIFTYSPAGATTVPATVKGSAQTTGWTELGIVSTPVIDLPSLTLFLVAETYENSQVVHRLHALDITTGLEKPGGPTTIAATYTHNGVTTTFKDFYQMNRPALLLANGNIFIAWGSNSNNHIPCQGWVMSYSASTLQPVAAITLEPGKNLASIWQKGAGIAADPGGNIYAVTGEGPYVTGSNLSISVVKLSQTTGLNITDFFTPYNHQMLATNDQDMTGILLLPLQTETPPEMIGIGKEGTIYLLNSDQMGGLCTTCTSGDTQIVQEIPQGAGTGGGNPTYWNNTVYFTGVRTPVQAYTVQNGMLVVPPVKTPVQMAGGGHSFITANGTTNGILWLMNGGPILWALDAVTLKTLYNTAQAPNFRDKLPPTPHFPEAIAADGKVFVGTRTSLVTYGLLPGSAAVKRPDRSRVHGE